MIASLLSTDYFPIFLIITIGLLVGKLEFKGISLGSSAVIFVGLAFGHFGVKIPDIFRIIGLLLFIFTIGIQAGPGFFENFKSNGKSLVLLATFIVILGAFITFLCSKLFGIEMEYAMGLFTGGLTSTPGLASAIDATKGAPETSIAYGIAYPFGVIGVILFVKLLPRILGFDLKKEEKEYELLSKSNHPELLSVNLKVENNSITNIPILDLEFRKMTGANISRILHKDEILAPKVDIVLNLNDIVKVVGTEKALKKAERLLGSVSSINIPKSKDYVGEWILVSNQKMVNKTLQQLNLQRNYNTVITRIRRRGVDITPTPDSKLKFGDKLMVVCGAYNYTAIQKLFGNESKKLSIADFTPVAACIILGVMLGKVNIPVLGTEMSLGLTGGVLLVALLVSNLGKTGPILWNISDTSNAMIRQIGLLFFLASVGCSAGGDLMETITSEGPQLFISGIAITLIPMILTLILGRTLFKINYLTLLGTITGGITSTPGLSAIDSMTESNAPATAYATVYPFAMVVLIICTKILALL